MDLNDRMNKLLAKKKDISKSKQKAKKKKPDNDKIIQSLLETVDFSSSDDDFEAPRFIVRSPRSGKKENGQGTNQTYRDVTPRRPSDKVKSVRAQSRSRDRTMAKTPNATRRISKIGNLEFTSDESDNEESHTRNQPVKRDETQSSLITDIFPQKKSAKSIMKTSAKKLNKKGHRLIVGDEDTQDSSKICKQDRVLVQDTEEDRMLIANCQLSKVHQITRVVEDSYVPDTEGSVPNKAIEHSESTVPESLVAETQEEFSCRKDKEHSELSIPDSFVPDSESTGRTRVSSSGTSVVPDSYVPETQSTAGNSAHFEVDTIPDSQDQSGINNGSSVQRPLPLETKIQPKPKKKTKSKKVPMKLFDQLEFSSDSSSEDNHHSVMETFRVSKADNVSLNPLTDCDSALSSDLSNRLLNILAKDATKPKKATKKGGKTKTESKFKVKKQVKASVFESDGKENKPSGAKSKTKTGEAAGKKKNIFEMFDFSSGSEEENVSPTGESHSDKVTNDFSDVSSTGACSINASVIDELSQRLTSIMNKKTKKKKKQQGKNISLQVSMLPEFSDDSVEQNEDEVNPEKEVCSMSIQVSMLEENELVESEPTSPVKVKNMSLQVSIMDSDEGDVGEPDPVTRSMSLQVSMAGPSSDEDGEDAVGSTDLALHISETSDANTTSGIKDKSNVAGVSCQGNEEDSVMTNDSSLQDAQRDSILSSDHDETLLSNESSTQSNQEDKTVFQTPPEELEPINKPRRNVSSGASPTLTAYKTSKQNLDAKRLSVGACSSSFYVPSETISPDDVGREIPNMMLSYEEETNDVKRVRSPKTKSFSKTPRRPQDETGYASMVGTSAAKHQFIRRRFSDSSSDDDDQLESFLSQQKNNGAKAKKPETDVSIDDFINDDSDLSECEVEEDDDEQDGSVFYIRTDRSIDLKNRTPSRNNRTPVSFDSESDEEEEARPVFKTPSIPRVAPKLLSVPRPKSVAITPKRSPLAPHNANTTGHEAYRWSFLRSLAGDTPNVRRHPDSTRYTRDFKKHKEELTTRLFKLFNETVFENKLPSGMSVSWNQRLYKTAGYCAYRKTSKSSDVRTARIELSSKVCDSAERVRDTLLHEMCHAAVWLIYGANDGHGPYWKYFAAKACQVHPELPPASRCHNYDIHHKFTYRCMKCGYQINRHSKSLNTTKKVCGHCHGEFELLVNKANGKGSVSKTPHTPRTPNKFAMFVKANYDSVKKSAQGLKHKDVMAQLSKDFAKTKLN